MSSFRSLAIAGLIASTLASPAFAGAKEGIDAWVRGDYAAATAEWRKYAVKGDADAQFNLGQAYKYGRGVPADLKLAQSWFQKAAVRGHQGAQANLGLMLFQNGSRAEAMPWLVKAAERGDPRAQYVVGTAAFNGDYAPKDWPRAYAMMTRAAASGLPQAGTSIATMDSYIPVEQRRQGITLAAEMDKQDVAARSGRPAAQPAPPIATVALPPSQPAQAVPAKPAPVRTASPAKTEMPARLATPAPAPVARAQPAPARTAQAKPVPVQARAVPAGGRGWRIQLGAFAKPGAAEKLWANLNTRPGLTGAQSFITRSGTTSRLQAGPFAGKAAADSACHAAKAAGAACFPVAP